MMSEMQNGLIWRVGVEWDAAFVMGKYLHRR
jgi:hypothetical protein